MAFSISIAKISVVKMDTVAEQSQTSASIDTTVSKNDANTLVSDLDQIYLLRALALAQVRRGYTAPNPPVGAVVVKDGLVLGEGTHQQAGSPHAEVEAIRACGNVDLTNATLYVTLEPCSTIGRTPPCTSLIIEHRFARVVIGCVDPNPKHASRGVTLLQKAGIDVCLAPEEVALQCRTLIAPFVKRITQGIPFITLKMAMTLDGRIADSTGTSRWITGSESRAFVQHLRLQSDAVLVGAETFRRDHPSLQPHIPNAPTKLRLIAGHVNQQLDAITYELNGDNLLDALREVATLSVCHILCEGGGRLAASLLEAGLVDELYLFYAPKLLLDLNARPAFSGGTHSLAQAIQGKITHVCQLGDDVLMHVTL